MYIIFYFFVYLKYKLIEINLYPYQLKLLLKLVCIVFSLLLASVMVRLITDLKYFVFV